MQIILLCTYTKYMVSFICICAHGPSTHGLHAKVRNQHLSDSYVITHISTVSHNRNKIYLKGIRESRDHNKSKETTVQQI